jgi:MFS transporter, PAT family, beta-lactamase induction signal transducer AmpG
MRLPNLFASARGRLAAFFLLYMTEGVPLGFAATAIATQLRRQGVGPAEIGAFIGSFYLPWAFKWAFGPVVDVFYSDRLGRRRGWILGTQVMMMLTLLATSFLRLPEQLGLFTVILLVHNTFAATQDVAIDALAVNVLKEGERATANGVMFAGASIGQIVGGSGALFVTSQFGFTTSFYYVAATILLVTLIVVLPMKEGPGPARVKVVGSALRAAGAEMRDFAITSFRSFLGTRGAFAGLGMALLPPGAMCLGLALQSNLAVELGLDDNAVATLNFWSGVISAGGCIVGGLLSDRFERRRMLSLYIVLMAVPVLTLATFLQHFEWIMPVSITADHRPVVPAGLITAFWTCTLIYGWFNGMMYSTTTAIYMDVTNPKVAATQFTAYMALFNLAIAYSSTWQGISIEAWGYPKTMVFDALYGLLFLLVLPLTRKRAGQTGFADALAPGRARQLATVLALLCAAWLPAHAGQDHLGQGMDIINILFTLIFIGSTLFLLAGAVLLAPVAPQLARWALRLAPLLVLMQLRNYLNAVSGWLGVTPEQLAQWLDPAFYVVPALGAALLWRMSRQHWDTLTPEVADNGPAGAPDVQPRVSPA